MSKKPVKKTVSRVQVKKQRIHTVNDGVTQAIYQMQNPVGKTIKKAVEKVTTITIVDKSTYEYTKAEVYKEMQSLRKTMKEEYDKTLSDKSLADRRFQNGVGRCIDIIDTVIRDKK